MKKSKKFWDSDTKLLVSKLSLAMPEVWPEQELSYAENKQRMTIKEILHSNFSDKQKIAKLIEVIKTLTTLDLSYCKINNAHTVLLVRALATNTTVSELNFTSNHIGAEGVKILADFLKTNIVLKSLDLSSNTIGLEGALALAQSLETNTTLSTLNLSFIDLSEEDILVFVAALKNTKLNNLELIDTHFNNDASVTKFVTALGPNTRLLSLTVGISPQNSIISQFLKRNLEKMTSEKLAKLPLILGIIKIIEAYLLLLLTIKTDVEQTLAPSQLADTPLIPYTQLASLDEPANQSLESPRRRNTNQNPCWPTKLI